MEIFGKNKLREEEPQLKYIPCNICFNVCKSAFELIHTASKFH